MTDHPRPVPTGGSILAQQPGRQREDCVLVPRQELADIRAALVELRRGMMSIERGVIALFCAIDKSSAVDDLDNNDASKGGNPAARIGGVS